MVLSRFKLHLNQFDKEFFLRKFVVMTLFAVVYFVSGCASTTRFTPIDYCSQPVNPEMARIILTRVNEFGGGGAIIRIFDNEQPLGDVGPGGRLCWDRYPGITILRGEMSSGNRKRGWDIDLITEANETYYLQGEFTGTLEISDEL